MNVGLISQNYDVIDKFNKKYVGVNLGESQLKSASTLRKMSDDEVKQLHQKEQSQERTLIVDNSEIINNVYNQTKDNITYQVDGVTFTNKEMKACKEIVEKAISCLPTKGSDLDYKDYASMGIASNMVKSYAKENLTDEQAAVVNKSMQDYLDSLVQAENKRHNGTDYYIDNENGVGNTGELNTYYNVRHQFGEQEAEALKSQISNLSTKTRNTSLDNLKSVTQKGGVVQSASNKELALSIKTLFENMDMKDENSVKTAMKKYQSLVTPAYRAYGLSDEMKNKSLTDVLNRDINSFTKQVGNANAVIDNIGKQCNYIL